MPAMAANPACELGALMVRDLARAEKLAAEHGATRAYGRVEDLFGDPELDAIYVSSPVYLHARHVLAAAEHGKHVLCEKPMGMSSGECVEMISACRAAGVHLEVCFVLRGWPIYHRVRATVASRRLGEIVWVRALLAKRTPRQESDWRLDPAKSGGGTLIDVGAHYLDLFRYLCGEFESIGYMGNSRAYGWEVEETATVSVAFASGAQGTLGVTCAVPFGGNLLEVYGTAGTLLLGKELRVITEEGEEAEPVQFPDYYSGLLSHFCECVEDGGEPMASGEDGLRNLEAIETAYRAGREGRILAVPHQAS